MGKQIFFYNKTTAHKTSNVAFTLLIWIIIAVNVENLDLWVKALFPLKHEYQICERLRPIKGLSGKAIFQYRFLDS